MALDLIINPNPLKTRFYPFAAAPVQTAGSITLALDLPNISASAAGISNGYWGEGTSAYDFSKPYRIGAAISGFSGGGDSYFGISLGGAVAYARDQSAYITVGCHNGSLWRLLYGDPEMGDVSVDLMTLSAYNVVVGVYLEYVPREEIVVSINDQIFHHNPQFATDTPAALRPNFTTNSPVSGATVFIEGLTEGVTATGIFRNLFVQEGT